MMLPARPPTTVLERPSTPCSPSDEPWAISTHLHRYGFNVTRLRAPNRLFAVKVNGDRKTLVLVRAQGNAMASVLKAQSQSLSSESKDPSASSPEAMHSNSSDLSGPEINGDGDASPEPPAKRQRVNGNGIWDGDLQDPNPYEWEEQITAVVDTRPSYDDGVQHLLRRSVAVALQTVGFDTASKEAFEALCGEIDSCKLILLGIAHHKLIITRHVELLKPCHPIDELLSAVSNNPSRLRIRTSTGRPYCILTEAASSTTGRKRNYPTAL